MLLSSQDYSNCLAKGGTKFNCDLVEVWKHFKRKYFIFEMIMLDKYFITYNVIWK